MKKIIYIIFILVTGQTAAGQDVKEHVTLFADRSLYITGERILFSAMLSQGSESSILYCEIITQKGSVVAGGKFNIVKSESSGSLAVPSDLVTGIYFFLAYTKMMRNDGPSSFSYLQLAIINPYLNDILGTEPKADIGNIQDNPENEEQDFVKIIPDKIVASPGDTIHVSLQNITTEHFSNLSVAVVPDNLPHYSQVSLTESGPEKQKFDSEKNGVSLSGSVRERNSRKLLRGTIVNLSILGKGHDFMATKTDSSGRFSFSLRGYDGYRDLFLCTQKDSIDQDILIDNDFCTVPLAIPARRFSLTEAERRAVYRMALNVEVDSLFSIKPDFDKTVANRIEGACFYGTPDETIKIDSYVQMPTLEDYFNELPTLVRIRKSSGRKYFRILNNQSGLVEFQPLVMVDLVALDDPEKILEIAPQDIDRIEIINSIYVKGEQIYGGIVNFISRRGDFGGINLPASGVLVRYGFPAADEPDEIKNPVQQSRPDARNTVLWIPHLSLTTISTFSFTAPSTPGRYLITVKGVTSEKAEFTSSTSFDVRP